MSEQSHETGHPQVVCASVRPQLHAETCSGGEAHPHHDCYCGVFENDDRPLRPCPQCVITPPASTNAEEA